ncbi:anthranilate synthase component I family protein [bacterium]|nr:anthranilate synthase component I family protein [bacterium]
MFHLLLQRFRPAVDTVTAVASEPLAVYEALYEDEPFAFLYESLADGERRGDFSILGARPLLRLTAVGPETSIVFEDRRIPVSGRPLDILRELLAQLEPADTAGPFSGGAVGYVAWDAVRMFEEIPDRHAQSADSPDISLFVPGEIIIFNHRLKTASLVVYSERSGRQRLAALKRTLTAAGISPCPANTAPAADRPAWTPSRKTFCTSVDLAREYIQKGDIFQTVLSRRLSFRPLCDDLTIYKRLRKANPSPYMYLLSLGSTRVLGSSPEVLVSCRDGNAITRPLAGTRPRTGSEPVDRALAEELLSDEKERAEHTMLVDLARNDLGRVCAPGSVRVTSLMDVEMHRRVMHLVSRVEGRLSRERDALDLFQACFPAGTVAGAPKPRAMEIIDELETVRRSVYAGSIGYFGADGTMDMCITIRTIWFHGDRGYLQAGAGIVADSDPEREYRETENKAAALLAALGLEDMP